MQVSRHLLCVVPIAASLLGIIEFCGLASVLPFARIARASEMLRRDEYPLVSQEAAVLAGTAPVDRDATTSPSRFAGQSATRRHDHATVPSDQADDAPADDHLVACDFAVVAPSPPCCMNATCGWLTLDYLHWWRQGDRVPALVTSSPAGTPRADAGVIGLPSTTVLFGDERISEAGRPGLRLGLGRWFDDCQDVGLGLEFFWVGDDAERFLAFSQGDTTLARPFFNTDPGVNGEDAQLVAFDDPVVGDVLDGTIRVDTSSETYSLAADFHRLLSSNYCADRGYRVHLVGGYRFLRLNESLRISESLLVTEAGGLVAQGTTLDILDDFGATNEFHGGEIGLRTVMCSSAWSMDVLAKLAIGNNHQTVRIQGQNAITVPEIAPFTRGGGLLAQSTNIGDYENDEVALLPELQFNLAWQWTPCVRLRVGYTLLYLTEAARPGNHMDRMVDGRTLDPLAGPVAATNPAFAFDSTSVWMQGVNVGIEKVW